MPAYNPGQTYWLTDSRTGLTYPVILAGLKSRPYNYGEFNAVIHFPGRPEKTATVFLESLKMEQP